MNRFKFIGSIKKKRLLTNSKLININTNLKSLGTKLKDSIKHVTGHLPEMRNVKSKNSVKKLDKTKAIKKSYKSKLNNIVKTSVGLKIRSKIHKGRLNLSKFYNLIKHTHVSKKKLVKISNRSTYVKKYYKNFILNNVFKGHKTGINYLLRKVFRKKTIVANNLKSNVGVQTKLVLPGSKNKNTNFYKPIKTLNDKSSYLLKSKSIDTSKPVAKPVSNHTSSTKLPTNSKSSFGNSKSSFGNSKSSFGNNKSSFGNNKSSFGNNKSSFGNNKSSFGDNKSSFGNNKSSFGNNKSSFGNNKQFSDVKKILNDTKNNSSAKRIKKAVTAYNPSKRRYNVNRSKLKPLLSSNTKLLKWLTTNDYSVLKKLLKKKIIYKLKLSLKKNRLDSYNNYQGVNNTYATSKKFILTNRLIRGRKTVRLSGDGVKLKSAGTKLTVRKKKNPNLNKSHFTLVSNLYEHLLNRLSLLSLKKINYNKSGSLKKTKYSFFKNMQLHELPAKLTKFVGAVDKDSKLDLKKKLFLDDLLPNTATRSWIHRSIANNTRYQKTKYFSKTSLVFFRESSLVDKIIKPAKRLQDRYRKNRRSRKLLFKLKLKLLNLRLDLGKKRKIKFRKTDKFKTKNFKRRKLARRFFKSSKFITKIKLPNRKVKQPWKVSKIFRKKWYRLRKKRRTSFFLNRRLRKSKRTWFKKVTSDNTLRSFSLKKSLIRKSKQVAKFTKLDSLRINDRHLFSALSFGRNFNSTIDSINSLKHRIDILNTDRFKIDGLTKGEALKNKIIKFKKKERFTQYNNVIRIVNLYKWQASKHWLLKHNRKKLLRSKINPELYLTSLKHSLTKYRLPHLLISRRGKRSKFYKIRYSNKRLTRFKAWRKKNITVYTRNKLSSSYKLKNTWVKKKWGDIKFKQTELVQKKWPNLNNRYKLSYKGGSFPRSKLTGRILRFNWKKDSLSKVWSKTPIKVKKNYNTKRYRVKLIKSKNKYIKYGYRRIGRWRKAIRSNSTRKIRTSTFRKRSIVDSFKTLSRPIINLSKRWLTLSENNCTMGVKNLTSTSIARFNLGNYNMLLYKLLGIYTFSKSKLLIAHSVVNNTTKLKGSSVSVLNTSLNYNIQSNCYPTLINNIKKDVNINYIFKSKSKNTTKAVRESVPSTELRVLNDYKLTKYFNKKLSGLKKKFDKLKAIQNKFRLLKSKGNPITIKKTKMFLNSTCITSYYENKQTCNIKKLCTSYLTLKVRTTFSDNEGLKPTTNLQRGKFSSFTTKFLYNLKYSKGNLFKNISNSNSILCHQPNVMISNLGNVSLCSTKSIVSSHLTKKNISKLKVLKNKKKIKNISSLRSATHLSSGVWSLLSHSIGFNKTVVINYDLFNKIRKSNSDVYKLAKAMSSKLSYEFGSLSPTFFIDEVINIILLSLRYKDANMLMSWVTYFFNKISINKHKKALAFMKKLFKKLYRSKKLHKLGCKGFMFDIRGKVGVSGSKKKRHVSILHGKRSASNKTLRWSHKKSLVYTKTGVLGVIITIYY
jgi:hypothetical protein